MKGVTKYVKGKIYIPKKIASEVGLEEGDKVLIEVSGPKTLTIRLLKKTPEEILIEYLEKPFEIGVPSPLKRRDIYENIR